MSYNYQPAQEYVGNLHVGQKVYSGLYGGRYGIISAIHGEQRPDTIQSIFKGVGVMGGHAHIDVVFDNGTYSRMIPEGIVRGIQWRISSDIVTPEKIEQAMQNHYMFVAQKEAEDKAKAEKHTNDIEVLKRQYPELIQGTDGKIASKNIKKQLKAKFPKAKFSVRLEHYDCINVRILSQDVDAKEVSKITENYKYGTFDSMQDLAGVNYTAWSDTFGGARYVFVHSFDHCLV